MTKSSFMNYDDRQLVTHCRGNISTLLTSLDSSFWYLDPILGVVHLWQHLDSKPSIRTLIFRAPARTTQRHIDASLDPRLFLSQQQAFATCVPITGRSPAPNTILDIKRSSRLSTSPMRDLMLRGLENAELVLRAEIHLCWPHFTTAHSLPKKPNNSRIIYRLQSHY